MSTEHTTPIEHLMPNQDATAFGHIQTVMEESGFGTLDGMNMDRLHTAFSGGPRPIEVSLHMGDIVAAKEGPNSSESLNKFLGNIGQGKGLDNLRDHHYSDDRTIEGALTIGFDREEATNSLLAGMKSDETIRLTNEGVHTGTMTRIGPSGFYIWARGPYISGRHAKEESPDMLNVDLIYRPNENDTSITGQRLPETGSLMKLQDVRAEIERSAEESGESNPITSAAVGQSVETLPIPEKMGVDAVETVEDFTGFLKAFPEGVKNQNGKVYDQKTLMQMAEIYLSDPDEDKTRMTSAAGLRDAAERVKASLVQTAEQGVVPLTVLGSTPFTRMERGLNRVEGDEVEGYIHGKVSLGEVDRTVAEQVVAMVNKAELAQSSSDLTVLHDAQDTINASNMSAADKAKLEKALDDRIGLISQKNKIGSQPVRNDRVTGGMVQRANVQRTMTGLPGQIGSDGDKFVVYDDQQPQGGSGLQDQ